jgi:GNAT superfamily N-acetyltransferase
MPTLELRYLADCPEVIPTVAAWHQRQFGHLGTITLEQRIARFEQSLAKHPLPVTFIAWQEGVPIGSASLVDNDMEDRPHLSPWFASLYVVPEARCHGVGAALLRRVVDEAAALRFAHLYLYTEDQMAFYGRRGWQAIEDRLYRGYPITIMALALPRPTRP